MGVCMCVCVCLVCVGVGVGVGVYSLPYSQHRANYNFLKQSAKMSGWVNFGLTLAIIGRTCWFFCSLIMDTSRTVYSVLPSRNISNFFSIRTYVVLSSVDKQRPIGEDNTADMPLAFAASALFRAMLHHGPR